MHQTLKRAGFVLCVVLLAGESDRNRHRSGTERKGLSKEEQRSREREKKKQGVVILIKVLVA